MASVLSAGAVWDSDVGPQSTYCTELGTAPDQVACYSNASPSLDLLAPGGAIESTWPGGGTRVRIGTSHAAPIVSACAASLLQADPSLDADSDGELVRVLHGQRHRRLAEVIAERDQHRAPERGAERGDAEEHIMPSKRLVFNEYRKHGTCSGLGVDRYFALSRELYEKVKIPAKFVDLDDDRMTISPGDLVREFMAANPTLRPDMIAVQCGGAGNRLREVRICFDKAGMFRPCGSNENQRRLCSADRMYVPPVRGSR
jgi:hypothetical protein